MSFFPALGHDCASGFIFINSFLNVLIDDSAVFFVVCVCWSVIFSNMFIYSSVISVTLPFSWAWEDKWFHLRKHTIRFCGLMFDHFTDLHRFSLNLSECRTTCEFLAKQWTIFFIDSLVAVRYYPLKNGRKQYFVMNSIRQIENFDCLNDITR